jgi:hypothetical protein
MYRTVAVRMAAKKTVTSGIEAYNRWWISPLTFIASTSFDIKKPPRVVELPNFANSKVVPYGKKIAKKDPAALLWPRSIT